MTQESKYTNQLIHQTSPYLLQHAHNPVDWYPWCQDALDRARAENKPILLSIGYSACHWCHVMAHESFEDPDTASVMNELFINIKVDREERPDLDKIYQTAHSLLAQRPGGWPLTMFLTPDDRIPFFGGTYFPREPRHGLPAFTDLMQRIVAFLHEHEDEIRQQNTSLQHALQQISATAPAADTLDPLPLDSARQQLEQQFDPHHGGFGEAPKFPHPTSIDRLLRHWAGSLATGRADEQALHMAVFTLQKMAHGGMYDQLGGGFCRYSVDDRWMIPHFEKMLYDNGPLLSLYSEVWAATGEPLFRRVCEETAAWVIREMQSPEGGYYSSLDADSEGEEGRFYVWTPEQVRELVGASDYDLFARRYGLDQKANFEGKWHLSVHHTREQLAAKFSLDLPELNRRIDRGRDLLFRERARRVHPGRDEKIVTSWNGLMIRGMAVAGRHLDEPACIESANRALDFIRASLWRDGRLLATCKDGHAHLPAYLDDYVYLIDGILELLQARWRDGELSFAVELAEVVLDHFQDEAGGFFFTADDHESLIQRPRSLADDSTPSGNGIAARVLGRLGHLLGESRYLEAATRTLKSAWSAISHSPYGHTSLLVALEEYLYPPQTVVIRGIPAAVSNWQALASQPYAPRRMSFAIPADTGKLPGLLAERKPQGEAIAYVCSGLQCAPPVENIGGLKDALRETDARLV